MTLSLSLPRDAVSSPATTALGSIRSLVRRLHAAAAAAHARQAARREAEAIAHLDPAILADIGLPAALLAPANPYAMAVRALPPSLAAPPKPR